METRNKELTIDILELIDSFMKHKWIIAVALVFSMMLGAVYTTVFVEETYTANTRMYVLNRSSEAYISSSDYSVSSYMIKDYEVLITGQNVTDEVIKRLNLDISTGKLTSMISVKSVDNTRVLQIGVVDTDPKRAADIANCVREVASEQIKEIVNVEAVNLVYEAKVPLHKSGPSLVKNTALAAIFGVVLCVGVLTVIYALDDSIRTEEDVERYLGLSVLGVVPVSSEMNAYIMSTKAPGNSAKKKRFSHSSRNKRK